MLKKRNKFNDDQNQYAKKTKIMYDNPKIKEREIIQKFDYYAD